MNNATILLKVKLRLNKLASNDFDNVEDWQVLEAFNKAQNDWCRRNLHGLNILKEGDEQSTRRIDDFQVLLEKQDLELVQLNGYQEGKLPVNYLQWKRVTGEAINDCCSDPARMVIYLAEQANVDTLLTDTHKKPSFEWRETFATLLGDKIQIYNDNKFTLVNSTLIFYRQPRVVKIQGIPDVYSGQVATADVESELKDDLIEIIIDETVKVLSGDIESIMQSQRASQNVENNN